MQQQACSSDALMTNSWGSRRNIFSPPTSHTKFSGSHRARLLGSIFYSLKCNRNSKLAKPSRHVSLLVSLPSHFFLHILVSLCPAPSQSLNSDMTQETANHKKNKQGRLCSLPHSINKTAHVATLQPISK